MKQTKYLFLVLIVTLLWIYSCERDDICSENTATTPHLIITFYDVGDQDELKNVVGLRAFGINDMDELMDVSGVDGSNTDSIVLPLRTNVNQTRFVLHRDYQIDDNDTPDDTSDDFSTGNPDVITISYNREEVYVSRACGFKTVFNNIAFTIDEENENPDDDLGNWLRQFIIEVPNNTIENEATAHINIFH